MRPLQATAGILIAVAVGVGLIMIDGGTTGQMDFGEAWYFAVVSGERRWRDALTNASP